MLTLSYPSHFESKFREVTLTGEAFFKIAKDSKSPFTLLANHSEVEVLYTSFNINTQVKQNYRYIHYSFYRSTYICIGAYR